jgi:hypothetical protein
MGVAILDFLRDEGVNPDLIHEIARIRDRHPVDPALEYRIPRPRFPYYGSEVWEQAITALLCGENLLLVVKSVLFSFFFHQLAV